MNNKFNEIISQYNRTFFKSIPGNNEVSDSIPNDRRCPLRGNKECTAVLDSNDDPVFKSDCCSIEAPCGLGEGSCYENGDCMASLVCGENNCDLEGGGKTNCCTTKWEKGPGFVVLCH